MPIRRYKIDAVERIVAAAIPAMFLLAAATKSERDDETNPTKQTMRLSFR
jgi:hypothetical protein